MEILHLDFHSFKVLAFTLFPLFLMRLYLFSKMNALRLSTIPLFSISDLSPERFMYQASVYPCYRILFSPYSLIHLSFPSYSHSSALLFISPPLFSLILSFLAASPLSCASTPLPLPLPFHFAILSKRRSHFSSSSPCDAGASPLAAGPPPPPGAAGTCGSSPPRRPRTCWARRSWRSGGRRWSRAASTGCCWSPAGGECEEKFRRKERAEKRKWVKVCCSLLGQRSDEFGSNLPIRV